MGSLLGPPIVLTYSPIKANILVDENHNARIADFGLLAIISDPSDLLSSSSDTQGGTVRWMSPELIDPSRFGSERSHPTKSSDCYALGMVVYETISGKLPFYDYPDILVTVKVVRGERLSREVMFTENLWETMELCWTFHPNDRPSIKDVLLRLRGAQNSSELPTLGTGGGVESGVSDSGSPGVKSARQQAYPDENTDVSTPAAHPNERLGTDSNCAADHAQIGRAHV